MSKILIKESELTGLIKKIIKEAISTNVYWSTFSGAVQHARAEAEKRGFEVDEDDWFSQINTGQGKPRDGQTTKANIGLWKDGKLSRRTLSIQVYNMGLKFGKGNNYELNYYIS